MDIALAGLLPLPLTGFQAGQTRGGQVEQQAPRADQQPATARGQQNRSEPGAHISSRFRSAQSVNTTQQSILERNAAYAQSDTRRFSLREAIFTLEQNQALIADPDNPRQISGIIDEYV